MITPPVVWFVALDTLRRRAALQGRLLVAARQLVNAAGRGAGACVLEACAVPSGVRAIVRTSSKGALRRFVRRLVALLALRIGARDVRWREIAQIRRVRPHDVPAYRSFIARCRSTLGDFEMAPKSKRNGKPTLRRAIALLQVVERSNEALLGVDEVAARVRRYVAAHEAPHDDRAAFAKLCEVIFAQGLGFQVVERHGPALEIAFHKFSPSAVAQIDEAGVGSLLHEPIIRNRSKIEACIENARRWTDLASEGAYLGRVAQRASDDDAAAGWPGLVAAVQQDFCRLREPTARLLLKRWGFFTALAHPGSQRVLTRLGLLDATMAGPRVQRFVGALAQASGKDPYAVEAALAIFAGVGPCRTEARCAECMLNESCPTATGPMVRAQAT